jgi:anti-sigma regulatory factor (Ser/Thr protein kinase)
VVRQAFGSLDLAAGKLGHDGNPERVSQEVGELPGAHRGRRGAAGEAEVLRIELAADAATPSLVRRRVRRWLDTLRWPLDHRDDIVTAVDEATANIVDHAYRGAPGGPMRITARRLVAGQLEISVRDWGRWRRIPAAPGHRGHGLTLMKAIMHRVDLRHHQNGTEVILRTVATVPGG